MGFFFPFPEQNGYRISLYGGGNVTCLSFCLITQWSDPAALHQPLWHLSLGFVTTVHTSAKLTFVGEYPGSNLIFSYLPCNVSQHGQHRHHEMSSNCYYHWIIKTCICLRSICLGWLSSFFNPRAASSFRLQVLWRRTVTCCVIVQHIAQRDVTKPSPLGNTALQSFLFNGIQGVLIQWVS